MISNGIGYGAIPWVEEDGQDSDWQTVTIEKRISWEQMADIKGLQLVFSKTKQNKNKKLKKHPEKSEMPNTVLYKADTQLGNMWFIFFPEYFQFK